MPHLESGIWLIERPHPKAAEGLKPIKTVVLVYDEQNIKTFHMPNTYTTKCILERHGWSFIRPINDELLALSTDDPLGYSEAPRTTKELTSEEESDENIRRREEDENRAERRYSDEYTPDAATQTGMYDLGDIPE